MRAAKALHFGLLLAAVSWLSPIVPGPSISAQESNPFSAAVRVDFIVQGVHLHDFRSYQCWYSPSLPGYDGCKTWRLEYEYRHGHPPTGIPFQYEPPWGGGLVWITATEINAYWDAFYSGWIRIGQPTCQYNCHSSALDIGVYICDTEDGVDVVLSSDFFEISEPMGQSIWATTEHSFSIGTIYADQNPNTVKGMYEKNGTSGTYMIIYPWPGYQVMGNLYQPW
jgi:hypothetical protein